jgi:hypothetical protein
MMEVAVPFLPAFIEQEGCHSLITLTPKNLPLRIRRIVLPPPPLQVSGFIETGKTILQPDSL